MIDDLLIQQTSRLPDYTGHAVQFEALDGSVRVIVADEWNALGFDMTRENIVEARDWLSRWLLANP